MVARILAWRSFTADPEGVVARVMARQRRRLQVAAADDGPLLGLAGRPRPSDETGYGHTVLRAWQVQQPVWRYDRDAYRAEAPAQLAAELARLNCSRSPQAAFFDAVRGGSAAVPLARMGPDERRAVLAAAAARARVDGGGGGPGVGGGAGSALAAVARLPSAAGGVVARLWEHLRNSGRP